MQAGIKRTRIGACTQPRICLPIIVSVLQPIRMTLNKYSLYIFRRPGSKHSILMDSLDWGNCAGIITLLHAVTSLM